MLAERVVPQLRKISELELKVAELTGAVDVLRGAAAPPPARFPKVKSYTEGGSPLAAPPGRRGATRRRCRGWATGFASPRRAEVSPSEARTTAMWSTALSMLPW